MQGIIRLFSTHAFDAPSLVFLVDNAKMRGDASGVDFDGHIIPFSFQLF